MIAHTACLHVLMHAKNWLKSRPWGTARQSRIASHHSLNTSNGKQKVLTWQLRSHAGAPTGKEATEEPKCEESSICSNGLVRSEIQFSTRFECRYESRAISNSLFACGLQSGRGWASCEYHYRPALHGLRQIGRGLDKHVNDSWW